jgi:hypothetical protein
MERRELRARHVVHWERRRLDLNGTDCAVDKPAFLWNGLRSGEISLMALISPLTPLPISSRAINRGYGPSLP